MIEREFSEDLFDSIVAERREEEEYKDRLEAEYKKRLEAEYKDRLEAEYKKRLEMQRRETQEAELEAERQRAQGAKTDDQLAYEAGLYIYEYEITKKLSAIEEWKALHPSFRPAGPAGFPSLRSAEARVEELYRRRTEIEEQENEFLEKNDGYEDE